MKKTVTQITYGRGGFDPSKPNNNVVETKQYEVEVPDEENN